MTDREASIIDNRMKTILDMYDRNNTIKSISDATGINSSRIQKLLSKNNYYHGIHRTQGTKERPINPIVDLNDFYYLIDYPIVDAYRA